MYNLSLAVTTSQSTSTQVGSQPRCQDTNQESPSDSGQDFSGATLSIPQESPLDSTNGQEMPQESALDKESDLVGASDDALDTPQKSSRDGGQGSSSVIGEAVDTPQDSDQGTSNSSKDLSGGKLLMHMDI